MRQVFQLKGKPHGIDRIKQFLDEGFICIGWPGIGDLTSVDRKEIKQRLQNVYPYSGQQLGAYTGAVNAFVNTLQEDDVVVVPHGVIVHVGIVGPYYYDSQYDNDEDGMCHRRKVTWTATLAKSKLNYRMLEFVKNRGIITKFPGTFEEAELNQLLTIDDDDDWNPFILMDHPTTSDTLLFPEEVIQKAKKALEEALNSDKPEIRIKAAEAILSLSK